MADSFTPPVLLQNFFDLACQRALSQEHEKPDLPNNALALLLAFQTSGTPFSSGCFPFRHHLLVEMVVEALSVGIELLTTHELAFAIQHRKLVSTKGGHHVRRQLLKTWVCSQPFAFGSQVSRQR